MASNPRAAEILAKLPRNAVHDMIEMLIERLDLETGDPDLEENDLEDSFVLSWYASGQPGAGCPISEPDHCSASDDLGCTVGSSDGAPGDPEDAEDDDPGGGNCEDEGEACEESEV